MNSPALPAIPARRNRLGETLIYRALVRWAVWSHFDRVWLKADGPLPHPADGPLIIYPNHPSWWDGYMCFLLTRMVLRGRFEAYLMMEEPQLRRYRFFTWAGCFSVDRDDPRSAARSVAYISRLLATRRARALVIFPQGAIAPNDRRPLEIYAGAAHIARRAGGATLWPVALRYEFRSEQRPEVFIRAGPVHYAPAEIDVRALTSEIAQRLTAAADVLRDDITGGRLDEYQVLLRGRVGVNRVWDVVRGRSAK
jgi:hypothetical protein